MRVFGILSRSIRLLAGARTLRQRGIAFLMFVVVLAGTIIPSASVVVAHAAADGSSSGNPQIPSANYPGPVAAVQPKYPEATDVQGTSSTLTGAVASGETLVGPPAKPNIVPHELTEKRTAHSSTRINKDGTLTQTHYFGSKFYK